MLNFLVFSDAQEISLRVEDTSLYPLPDEWIHVSDGQRTGIMRMLSSQLESSHKKLYSFRGVFSVQYEQGISLPYVQALDTTNSNNIHGDTIQKVDFSFEIMADLNAKKVLRKKIISQHEVMNSGKAMILPNTSVSNHFSVISNIDYLFSDGDKIVSPLPELPTYPYWEGKKLAWREPPENMLNQSLVVTINPCEFFDGKKYGNIAGLLDCLDGKKNEDEQKLVNDTVSLFESVDGRGYKWFRLHRVFSNGSNYQELDTYYSEEVNFLPVFSMRVNNKTILKSLIRIRWNKIKEVFFPVNSLTVVYQDSGKLSYRRELSLEGNIEINQPVNPDSFSCSALGLEDGDILVDRIKQQVFTIQNDKPVYLAKFYEKYQTPHERSINRVRMFMIILGFTLIVLGLYLKIRRKRSENTPK